MQGLKSWIHLSYKLSFWGSPSQWKHLGLNPRLLADNSDPPIDFKGLWFRCLAHYLPKHTHFILPLENVVYFKKKNQKRSQTEREVVLTEYHSCQTWARWVQKEQKTISSCQQAEMTKQSFRKTGGQNACRATGNTAWDTQNCTLLQMVSMGQCFNCRTAGPEERGSWS